MNDAFAVLGLTPDFGLTRGAIEAAYLARIAGLHPDRIGPGVGDGDGAVDAAALNDARRALLVDERRANLVLEALGGPSARDDDSLPDGFLMEMMETRMEIEEAMSGGDEAERERWRRWADEARSSYVASVGGLFARVGDGDGDGLLVEIRRTLNAWRYIERLIEQLDPAYDPGRADFV